MRVFGRVGWSLLPLMLFLGCFNLVGAAQSVTAKLPLVFEPNQGQAPGNVRYVLRKGALEGEFQQDGVRLRLLSGNNNHSQVSMRLVGTRKDAAIAGDGALEGHTNYLLGSDPAHWLHGLPNYSAVRYSRIYPGTDLVFYGNDGALEHDFEVQPEADPSRIAFQLDARNVTLEYDGNLRIGLADGAIIFKRPVAYQVEAGMRHPVDAAFTVDRDGTVRFRLGNYNRSETLVIDPVLSFATYLDTLSDTVSAIATDAAGNTYITGLTFNTSYPVTSGVFEQTCAACANNEAAVFVTKLNATGTAQVYSTFLGGSQYNQPFGIAVDSAGNAVVTGYTASADFPLKNPISAGTPSYMDGFVTSLSPDGASLNFSSRLGGAASQSSSAPTFPGGVAVDSAGNVFVSGTTQSPYLPVTPGALNAGVPSYYTDNFVFLMKFQQTGALVYSALLGNTGEASECCSVSGVAVDSAGNAYVAGTVGVTEASYATPTPITPWPITAGAYQSAMIAPGDDAPFAAKVSADGSTLLYSTLVTTGEASGMALTSSDEVILVGSPNYNYPVTSNAYSSKVNSSFIAELSADGSQLPYSSYFGGTAASGTTANAVKVDGNGNIWLAGLTRDSTFPLVTPLVAQMPYSPLGESVTSFLSEFDPTLTQLKFSTFMGDLSGSGLQIALDAAGNVHAAGTTAAPIYTNPGVFLGTVTPPPQSVEYTYPYAALINPATSSGTVCLGGSGLSFGYLLPQTTVSQSIQVTNCGGAPLTISSVASSNTVFTLPSGTNGCTGEIAVGSSCSVSVAFTPTAAQAYAGMLTFTSNASIPTTTMQLNGNGGEPVAGFGPPGSTQYLVFSPELVGQTSAAQYLGFYNNGPVPLTIYLSQMAVTSGFALAPGGTCPSSLSAYQSCFIPVVFAPATAGTFNGTLSVSSNDPVHPTISTSLIGTAFSSYPIPTVTGLLNPSYPMNSGTTPITMIVEGTNFFPTSVVYVNGIAQTTAYQSGNFLTVTFNPSILNAVGEIPVTVVNPEPGGGSSAPYPLTVYLSIPLAANALTVDPVGGLLYAAIPSGAAQNPNTVIPINPATGAMMTPIAVASNPQRLAVSDDGTELYVASTGVLQRFNLKTQALEKTFNLPVDSEWGQTYAEEMHVVPGSPQSIVVELFADVDPAEDGAALYNDSGLVNWIPGQSLVNGANSIFWLDSFTFTSSPSMIYGLPTQLGNSFFVEVQVSTTGLKIATSNPGTTGALTGSIVRSDGTLLYTNSGEVWNPSTQTLLGTYLDSNGTQLFDVPSIIPDTANGHTYFLDPYEEYSQYEAVNIDVYDQASYALLGAVPFTTIYPPDVTDLVRWGSNGFAFRCVDISGSQPSANQIVILTSTLIPSSSGAPIPILSSVSPAQVYAGGQAFSMQLTGSGFTSASTVLVNNNPRTTTYVSGTSLAAEVLASDITNIGQLNVQVTTPAPGGGTSNYATVSVDPLQLITPTLTVTPSSTNITTTQALTVTVAVSGGSGNPNPTGSVTLTGGGYTSAATTLSSGSATISIPAGSLTTGSDTLTASYTPDSSSSAIYNDATGSGSVAVTTPVSQNFTISGTALSVAPGATTGNTSTISVTPVGGFTGSVALSAALTGSPAGAADLPTFSFGTTTPVSITGSNAGSATLTVFTTQATNTGGCSSANLEKREVPWYRMGGVALACVFLFGIGTRNRNWRTTLGMVAILGALAGAMSACGGNSGRGCSTPAGSPGTTAGNYTITITGASGTITQSATVTVTVQ